MDQRELRWRGYLQQIAEGNSAALSLLYHDSAPIVNGFALRMLRNPADAEEVVLEVFEQVWRMAARYDSDRSRVLWWLTMLTRSRALDRIRSTRRRSEVEEAVEVLPEFDAHGDEPEYSASMAEEQVRMWRALSELPPEQRQALELAFFSEMSHSEIAKRLDLPLGTIKTRIRTALRRMRDCLDRDASRTAEQSA